MTKKIIYLFIIFVFFIKPALSQSYLEKFKCVETNVFKIYSEGFSYEKDVNNIYFFNLTNSHLVFMKGSVGSKNYIKLPIKNRNGKYIKIYQDNINLSIQLGPLQNQQQIKDLFYLKYSRNDIFDSEMSYSECELIK
tara:strand:+ start:37 stop:447 length:411 start_codon:yes stop_codon:yes gene_type:complete